MVNLKNEITIFEEENIRLEVSVKDDTVWLTQRQIAMLFDVKRPAITKHLNNIFKTKELDELSVCSKMEHTASDNKKYVIKYYNLDAIISLGYRINSKKATEFRKWANKIIKDYLLEGYVINKERLNYLEKTIKLIDIANRIDDNMKSSEANDILKIIGSYTKALNLLNDYDYNKIKKKGKIRSKKQITYTNCIEIINRLKFNEKSKLFALERDKGLEGIINDIYQTFNIINS